MPSVEDNLKRAVQKRDGTPDKTFYIASYSLLVVTTVEVSKVFSRTYEDFTGRKYHKETTYEKLCDTELEAYKALEDYCIGKALAAQKDLVHWQERERYIHEKANRL